MLIQRYALLVISVVQMERVYQVLQKRVLMGKRLMKIVNVFVRQKINAWTMMVTRNVSSAQVAHHTLKLIQMDVVLDAQHVQEVQVKQNVEVSVVLVMVGIMIVFLKLINVKYKNNLF